MSRAEGASEAVPSRELTPLISDERQEQRALKVRTLRLRDLRRRMERYRRELAAGVLQEVPAHHRTVFDQFMTGAFDKELDELTQRHDYGQLRTQPERLGSLGFLRRSLP